MSEITALNGAPLKSERETRVVLVYENATGKLQLDGDLTNVDRVLNVLAQAQEQRQVASLIARPH